MLKAADLVALWAFVTMALWDRIWDSVQRMDLEPSQ